MSAVAQETKEETPHFKEKMSGMALLAQPSPEYEEFLSSQLQFLSLPQFYAEVQELTSKKKGGQGIENEFEKKCLCLVLVGMSRMKEARNKSQFMRVYFTDLEKYKEKTHKSLFRLRRFQNDLSEGYLQISAFIYKPALQKIMKNLQTGSVWLFKDPKLLFLGQKEKLELKEESEENVCYVGLAKEFKYCKESDERGHKCINFVNATVEKDCDMHKRIKQQKLIVNNERIEINGGMALIDPSRLFGGVGMLKPRKMTAAVRDDFFGEDSVRRFTENLRRYKREKDEKKRGAGQVEEKKLNQRQEKNKLESEEFLKLRSKKFQQEVDLMGRLEEKEKQEELELKEKIERSMREKKEAEEKREKEFDLVVSFKKECRGVDFEKVLGQRQN